MSNTVKATVDCFKKMGGHPSTQTCNV